MPYLINKTSGAKITTVQDGTIDSTSLDITLVGKNFTGYGEVFNENFVKLLENFSSNARPSKPLTGQLWYDSTNRAIKLYTGVGTQPWKSLGLLESSSSRPVGNNAGDLWFSPTEGRLYAYSGVGSNWILVGPVTSRLGASGAIEYSALREGAGESIILKLLIDGKQPVIISSETFSVNSADPIYTSDVGAYQVIKKGITLGDLKDSATGVSYTPNTGGSILWGTAASALGMVRSDDLYYPADSFLLTAALASLPNKIILKDDEGILIGDQGIMKLHITDGNTGNVTIINQDDGRVAFKLNIGSTSSNVVTVTTASTTPNQYLILPDGSSTIWMGTDSQRFSYGYFNTVTALSFVGPTISGTTITDNGNRVLTSVTVNAGTGISGGGTITGPSGSVTINNTGVLSVAGTANQISVTTATGNVTFSLPQNIDLNANVGFAKVNATTVTSVEVYDSGARVITTETIGANGVTFIQGTTNQVSVSANKGSVALSLPQNIHTGASPTFNGLTLNGLSVSSISANGGSGTVSGAWSLVAGSTFQATFADLAERYAADAEYEPGTVLVIGGSAEVTTTTRHGDTARAGIVSTAPAYTLNAEAGDDSTHPLIALAGRVPCKVKGFVRKGDLLVTSTEAGYAEAAHANDHPNAVLARALEDFEGTTGIIQVMVV